MEITTKNILLDKQNAEITTKNLLITDSIDYAQLIQEAILPPMEEINVLLPDSFILFKPKAIVSGDFYWMYQIEGEKGETQGINENSTSPASCPSSPIFIATVDCTGHGVPGAFMSIIGSNLLQQILERSAIKGDIRPATVLNQMNKDISKVLHQNNKNSAIKDGMDMTLVSLKFTKPDQSAEPPITDLPANTKPAQWQAGNQLPITPYCQLEFAGAQNSLYLVRNRVLTEIKADKQSIGKTAYSTEFQFTNHTIELQKGDIIYTFSDGFADQKGGAMKKKFYYPPFRELLASNSHLPMEEQKAVLDKTITEWMGATEQIDDIMVIGTIIK